MRSFLPWLALATAVLAGSSCVNPVCTPRSCGPTECHSIPDGCDGTVSCGECDGQYADCVENTCRLRCPTAVCLWPYYESHLSDDPEAMHATGPEDIWVGGDDGYLGHWDGQRWRDSARVATPVHGLWTLSPWDAWAGGDGRLYHWNGGTWLEEPTPDDKEEIRGVWGSGPEDLWAAGNKGSVLRWNGNQWITHAQDTAVPLNAVWGSGPGDVWVAGELGVVRHFNGQDWENRTVVAAAGATFRAGWADHPGESWVAGGGGKVFRWTGMAWETMGYPAEDELYAVLGNAAGRVLVAGEETASQWDGQQWVHLQPPGAEKLRLRAAWGDPAQDVWLAGVGILFRWRPTWEGPSVKP